jgi:transposase
MGQGPPPNPKVPVVKRPDDIKGFRIPPRRWVVERTFGWLMRHRRLVRDNEATESSAEAWAFVPTLTGIRIDQLLSPKIPTTRLAILDSVKQM